jgi:mono/diheme cytochrome c family protein
MKAWRALAAAAAALALLVGGAAAVVAWINLRGDEGADTAVTLTPELVERGAYLARAGHCAGCHTARGGVAYAGGRGITTPFGTVYAGNLTPDPETGLGRWSPRDFWRALHLGRSREGRLLYPAFPYPNTTLVTRADADALYAFLRSLPAVAQPRPAHELRAPYGTQAALAVWRALYFRPATFAPEPARGDDWNRGAYLVRGLGHCEACHAARNGLGATTGGIELGGGLIPVQNWYAPSLASPHEAGVADWPLPDIVALLKTGRTARGGVLGPMAEVVRGSTQHLSDADLRAMAVFLQQLPQQASAAALTPVPGAEGPVLARGKQLYADHCAACHGEQGEGAAGAYPPLAGNRIVTLDPPLNLVRVIVGGGFPPATAGNPRPYGMPPFGTVLNDADIAALATWLRQAWGHRAAPVTDLQVLQAR